jgi:hypothetical protein
MAIEATKTNRIVKDQLGVFVEDFFGGGTVLFTPIEIGSAFGGGCGVLGPSGGGGEGGGMDGGTGGGLSGIV